MKNPSWSRDEIILSLDFYFHHRDSGKIPGKTSNEINRLSEILRQLYEKLGGAVTEKFRNPSSVYMKMMNYRHFDPEYDGEGLKRGSRRDGTLFREYAQDRVKLCAMAVQIKSLVDEDEPTAAQDIDDHDIPEILEGRLVTRVHRFRERNRRIVELKKEQVFDETRELICEGCAFDFDKRYGRRMKGFIECHHTKPVSQLAAGEKTLLHDLSLVCSNCHRTIHRKAPWLTMTQLRQLVTRYQQR